MAIILDAPKQMVTVLFAGFKDEVKRNECYSSSTTRRASRDSYLLLAVDLPCALFVLDAH